MKIMRLVVHNVMGVRDIDTSLDGKHLWLIGGKNAQGKTSVLQALIMALCGKRGCDWPGEPLRNGEESGWVTVEMEGSGVDFQDKLKVERRWTRNGDKIKEEMRVMSEDGFEAPEPQRILNDLYVHRGFDPLAFLQLKPKDQAEQLRKFLDIDFRMLDQNRAKFFTKRSEVNGAIKNAKANLKPVENPGDPVYIDVESLESQVNEINELANSITHQKNSFESLRDSRDGHVKLIAKGEDDLKELEREYLSRKARAEEFIAEEKDKHEASLGSIASITEMIEARVADLEKMGSAVDKRSELAKARQHNDKVQRQVEERDRMLKLEGQVKKLEEASNALTESIEGVDAEKVKMLAEAPWPVPGLAFGDDGLVYNDVPLEQCSTRERTDVSIALGMSANPKLRMMVVQHGESIDDESLSQIEKRAEENDYQILVEFMTRGIADLEDLCQVVMEAGVDSKAAPKGVKKKAGKKAGKKSKAEEPVESEEASGDSQSLPGM